MNPKTLERFGLTKGESKVYLALLRIKKSTIGNIIKEANVSNSKIYDILDRLNKKGLVGVITQNNKRSFEAKSPEILKQNLEEQEESLKEKHEELDSLLPSLKGMFDSQEVKQEAELLQGLKGFKSKTEAMLNDLEKGDTFYILGAPKEANEKLEGYLQDWHSRRIKKGVKCKILYETDAEKWAKKRKKSPITEIGFLPKEIKSPTAVDISNNYVAIIAFEETPLVFTIKNSKIAKSYREYFELLWKIAKK
ncbi:hypothetical protein HN832_04790 [archaeon]|jgi:sugar-specific transcriptional regulator TrmB|nr:hypothetical protein [archaeon]MBT4374004.1 hypothetical protein [archaeon]MBT4532100.1 hypothetical protein [archaeon]MBT7001990.1 hypothetical protein [archaeon]MBT7282701.1 hypothetical protein [archaeon]